jgi:hypothetical protein
VRWDLDDDVGALLHLFSGVNFSGTRYTVRILRGGRVQGPDVPVGVIQSGGLIADHGIRLTFITARQKPGWEDEPWRAVVVTEADCFPSMSGHPAVQVPDLDQMDPPDAIRTDDLVDSGFPLVDRLEDGVGWTFGRVGRHPIKRRVHAIRLDRLRDD